MDTTERKQKVSATEKRYAKYLGKLYWERDSEYKSDIQKYLMTYRLCMVIDVRRRTYGNRFMLTVQRLEGDGKEMWKQEAARFARLESNGGFVLLDKANPVRPASYMSDSWRG